MGETRVNLKHLLEDIRDSYPTPVEETIITELAANSLDARASLIEFRIDAEKGIFTAEDNGTGMNARQFHQYHDIAMTTKSRGEGIGFAGIGSKLGLLIAEEVYTETAREGVRRASIWKLTDPFKAEWQEVPPRNLLKHKSGTLVQFALKDRTASRLLEPDFVVECISRHFAPLLHEGITRHILSEVYPSGVAFVVNGVRVGASVFGGSVEKEKLFVVYGGRRTRPLGVGILCRCKEEVPEAIRGVAISTYGKVIKRGWEWLGIMPRHPEKLWGIVEVPGLARILTTNKADFLRDPRSLSIYYRVRKAVQRAIESVLNEFEEFILPSLEETINTRPILKEITEALKPIIDSFPELKPIVGYIRRGTGDGALSSHSSYSSHQMYVSGVEESDVERHEFFAHEDVPAEEHRAHSSPATDEELQGGAVPNTRRLSIAFDYQEQRERELGWLTENIIWINTAHPAFRRAQKEGTEKYHIVFTVGWVLSQHLSPDKSPSEFLAKFLEGWGSTAVRQNSS